jgi:GT2 family glycosyltransferase
LPLDHVSFIKQCEEIANSGAFDLVSGMTNRLGLNYQLVGGKMSENTDISKDVDLAKSLALKHGSKVDPTTETVAGFFMLFSKDIWDKVGGFPEGAIMINGEMVDYIFSNKVIEKGGKIGIAKGIYLFHLYRWGKNRKDKSHLI